MKPTEYWRLLLNFGGTTEKESTDESELAMYRYGRYPTTHWSSAKQKCPTLLLSTRDFRLDVPLIISSAGRTSGV